LLIPSENSVPITITHEKMDLLQQNVQNFVFICAKDRLTLFENIDFPYPFWVVALCPLIGLAYALLLYQGDTSFREQSKSLNKWLGVLRFLGATLLCLLLLNPFIKSKVTQIKKPAVVFGIDKSESIGAVGDAQKSLVTKDIQSLKEALSKDYDIYSYDFGSSVRESKGPEFQDKSTDISAMMQLIYDQYSNQNLGSVILATDGIFNQGSHPAYATPGLNAPVISIAMGDTTPKKDALLKNVFHNRIAYLGDQFNVSVDVSAYNLNGKSGSVSIFKVEDGKELKLKDIPVNIRGNDFFKSESVLLNADKPGIIHYRFRLSAVPGEVSSANNVKDIYIEVLDARQKILLLANSPHPDIAAIKNSLDGNKNYQVSLSYAGSESLKNSEYDFVVLHQLPSNTYDATGIIKSIRDQKIPHLFVIGSQTSLVKLNTSQDILSISGDGRSTNDVQPKMNNSFNYFSLDPKEIQDFSNYTPLLSPFGNYKSGTNAQVLMYQKIGKVETQYPLVVMGESAGVKTGIIAGEGIWKWRLFDYLQNKSHEQFDGLFGKMINFIAVKDDKRKFRVSPEKNLFDENEQIAFDAELYNDSYELVNEPDAFLSVLNEAGKEFKFNFSKNGRSYRLNIGFLPPGSYRFKGSTSLNNKALTMDGKFSVRPVQLELFETTANHGALKVLAKTFGGETIAPGEWEKALAFLKQQKTMKPIQYVTSRTRSVINMKWLFGLALLFLGTEWFLRKYFGRY
jgi:hypothetical protein